MLIGALLRGVTDLVFVTPAKKIYTKSSPGKGLSAVSRVPPAESAVCLRYMFANFEGSVRGPNCGVFAVVSTCTSTLSLIQGSGCQCSPLCAFAMLLTFIKIPARDKFSDFRVHSWGNTLDN
eukprot:4055286-Amphidinium_carterae.1